MPFQCVAAIPCELEPCGSNQLLSCSSVPNALFKLLPESRVKWDFQTNNTPQQLSLSAHRFCIFLLSSTSFQRPISIFPSVPNRHFELYLALLKQDEYVIQAIFQSLLENKLKLVKATADMKDIKRPHMAARVVVSWQVHSLEVSSRLQKYVCVPFRLN